jgi:hypothetical protein
MISFCLNKFDNRSPSEIGFTTENILVFGFKFFEVFKFKVILCIRRICTGTFPISRTWWIHIDLFSNLSQGAQFHSTNLWISTAKIFYIYLISCFWWKKSNLRHEIIFSYQFRRDTTLKFEVRVAYWIHNQQGTKSFTAVAWQKNCFCIFW